MSIKAVVIEDSISAIDGKRLTTLQLRYPRFIHAEFMTHRIFSRNASSSRAIPVSRLIQDIIDDPAEPVKWGTNRPGMQAGEEMRGLELASAKAYWREDREHSILMARALDGCGASKQLVNRLIENHGHINVVCTATEFANWFALRNHWMADPTIEALAIAMWNAMEDSKPVELGRRDWHTPYVNAAKEDLDRREAILCSVARCARVSYLTHDLVKPKVENDLRLAHDLVGSTPKHASPAEHQARPLAEGEGEKRFVDGADLPTGNWIKNFNGWRMYRADIADETVW
jgi:hypothetical protein